MNWKQKVKAVADYHFGSHFVPSWNQKDTARALETSEKQIHMILEIYKYFSDPEINKCPSIDSAYKILLKRKNEKKTKILNQLMKEE